jgi:hypothetical protein
MSHSESIVEEASKKRKLVIDEDPEEVKGGYTLPKISEYRDDIQWKKQKLCGPHPTKSEEIIIYCWCKDEQKQSIAAVAVNGRYTCAGRKKDGKIKRCGLTVMKGAVDLLCQKPLLKGKYIAYPYHSMCGGCVFAASKGSRWSGKNRLFMSCACKDYKDKLTFGFAYPELARYFNVAECEAIVDNSMVTNGETTKQNIEVELVAPSFSDTESSDEE